jgi:probable DNA repair protein
MPQERLKITRLELFRRLAAGQSAGITVVTPNARLAQALAQGFDASRMAAGLTAWETADILPFGAFVARMWEEAMYSPLSAGLPVLLTPTQELALWDESIGAKPIADAIFSAPSTAAQCREAWRLAHGWRLDPRAGEPNRDVRAYLEWSARYERATHDHGQTDSARLPDVVARIAHESAVRKPATLALCGFDIETPQMRDFFGALAAAGAVLANVAAPDHKARIARVELTQSRDEIEAAARWARTRLEANAKARIGIVVPDLIRNRAQVARTLAAVMRPGYLLEDEVPPMPFNLSLGVPLADAPLVADALQLLALAGPEIAFESASRLVRSPFIAGAELEMDARARLDVRLRKRATPALSLEALRIHVAAPKGVRAPMLQARLAALAETRKASLFGLHGAAEWARAFTEALKAMGFPGERTLDSAEYQALQRWYQLLAEFATLERVTGKMKFSAACAHLARMARAAIFQPEAGEVPIQVMGVLESAGQEFDHLWVMGLTDEAWPLPPRPNAFLPIRAQRAAGIPQADPAASLELDRAITAGWMSAAPEVVLSHARMRDESELAPSALITPVASVRLEELRIAPFTPLRGAIRAAARMESVEDGRAPPAAAGLRTGGTALFKDQAACPFRAYSRHRLDARELEAARFGLDARDRGSLLHDMFARMWKAIGSYERLVSMAAPQQEKMLARCAEDAIEQMRRSRADTLSGRFGRLEHDRLIRLASEWLVAERERDPFQVIATEEKRELTFGGVTVNAKLDRMDRLAAGSHAVIDYKTGVSETKSWMGKRPDEPQLPLYALSQENVAAVAFGQIRTGDMRFRGIGREPNLIPGVITIDKDRNALAKRYEGSWDRLVEGWRVEIEAAGRGFREGDARVDPKSGRDTCKMCDQHTFCRIAEKAPFGVAHGDDTDE